MDNKMSFTDSIKTVFSKYATFEGRARRSEFWWWCLFTAVVSGILSIFGKTGNVLSGIFALAVLLPNLAVGARRLHDINKSGWNLFLAFIPLVGAIILILWFVREGDPSENQYGPNPKEFQM